MIGRLVRDRPAPGDDIEGPVEGAASASDPRHLEALLPACGGPVPVNDPSPRRNERAATFR